jgi:hypothetical protein
MGQSSQLIGPPTKPVRFSLADWRSLLTGDVARAREAFRQLLTTPIRFTPFVDKKGFHALRFEGRVGLDAVFGGVVTQMASPRETDNMCRRLRGRMRRAA